ncbi:relaxase/mobilization nuclease domain-containing protein [Ruthenibacterium lactatiformans]|uniref:relaxase/mobilization nuclease domain-containing protein n=1 Tax=Ruthenibacterium lactatiformans TaxID=1550024 RepID=UPI003FD72CB9
MATVTFIKYKRQTGGTLRSVAQYVSQAKKTVAQTGHPLTSGLNCTPHLAAQEFIATRTTHRKDSPVWFYHYVQSFSPEEKITGEQAHRLAKEFAARAWPDNEVLITTHLDAAHFHTHFIVNSVCYGTGRMLRQEPGTLHALRQMSDELCMKYGFSVLPREQGKNRTHGMDGREYRSAAKGESWKFRLIATIDQCMRYASDKEEFIALMQSDGYGVRWTDSRKSITYTTPQGMKCRDDRLHSERYRKEVMELELRTRTEIIHGRTEAAESIPVFFAADADYTSAGANTTGLEGTADRNGPIRAPSFGPDSRFAGAFHPDGCLPHPAPDRGPVAGCGPDTDAAATGWEEERAAFLCAQVGAAANPLAQPDSRTGSVPGSWRYALGSMVQLGKALEPAPSDFPVKDSTVKPRHTDRKLWQTQRRKKIALGHKPDDQENESVWQHSL